MQRMLNLQEQFPEASAPMQIGWIGVGLDELAADHSLQRKAKRSSAAFSKIHVL